jgi:hypothetical protein
MFGAWRRRFARDRSDGGLATGWVHPGTAAEAAVVDAFGRPAEILVDAAP